MYWRNPDFDIRALEQQVKQSKDPSLALELFNQQVRRGHFSQPLEYPSYPLQIDNGFFLIQPRDHYHLWLIEDTSRITSDLGYGYILINGTFYRLINWPVPPGRYIQAQRKRFWKEGVLEQIGNWTISNDMREPGLVPVNQAADATTYNQRLEDWRTFVRRAHDPIRKWADENQEAFSRASYIKSYNDIVDLGRQLENAKMVIDRINRNIADGVLTMLDPDIVD